MKFGAKILGLASLYFKFVTQNFYSDIIMQSYCLVRLLKI